MNTFLKKAISSLLSFTLLFSCCLFNLQLTQAQSLSIINSEGNGTWNFLSSNSNLHFADSNLALSDEVDKLVSLGDYTDSNSVTHKIYAVGGPSNPTNTQYNYGDMTFYGTADAAVTFRAYKGFGRINLDPGASVSVPVNGPCKINVLMFVDANPASGSAGYTGTETGTTEDGKLTLYADGTEFASQTPIALSKGTNESYQFVYSGNKPAEIKFENTGSKILALATVSTKHILQEGADVSDCSESKNFPFTGKVYTVGDSTVCNYDKENSAEYNYRQGWAMRLGDYFPESVTVNNLALSGRSSRSFVSEANYKTLFENIKTGDYLLIQFGHNDEKVNSDYLTFDDKYKDIYSVPISKIGNGTLDWRKSDTGLVDDGNGNSVPCFEWFLYNKYVKPAREAGAQPVLVTPITRRSSSGSANNEEKHNLYCQAIRQVAADYKVPLIDLHYDSTNYWNEVYAKNGADGTAALHALKTDGTVDNTHLSKVGAEVSAKMVAESAKKLGLALGKQSTVTPEKVTEITVDANALQTNVSTFTFKTVTDALRFLENANTPTCEEERVTVNFKKGTYREQIFVNTPYVTFKNADSTSYKDVILTWYYGIGYKYYSIGADGFYDKDTMRENKINDTYTAAAKNWGHTVRVNSTATGFKADNITFESSFNRYVTQEEIDDGCVPVDVSNETEKKTFYSDGKTAKPDRASLGVGSTKVQTKNKSIDYRERSCAFFVLADKTEMTGCYFVSEQDTLGTNHNRQYYKDCIIEGTVDYICGTGNSIFDNCELRWGTTANYSGGYVSAPKGNYLFYNCKVTGNGNDKTNAWARPWGGQNSNATMFKTVIEKNNNGKLNIAGTGYSNMSSNIASESKFYEYGSVDANGNAIDLSGRLKNTVQPFGTVVTDKWLMLEFNPYNYTTGRYGADNPNVSFTPDDWDPMNRAERMKPILDAINVDLSTCGEKIVYNETDKVYEVADTSITLPTLAEGYERKVVSNSSNVVVSSDSNTLTLTIPESGATPTTASITMYVREKDSDEWGDKKIIDLKLTADVVVPEKPVEPEKFEKGDFNGDLVIDINDASSTLDYVLDPTDEKFKNYTDKNFEAAKVCGNDIITSKDVSEILQKVIDPNFNFSGSTSK